MTGLVLVLEQNALYSLEHGVHHYLNQDETGFLEYTVLHTFHPIEMFLKARLAKEHWMLMFDEPEKAPANPKDEYRTVDFNTLIQRPRKAGDQHYKCRHGFSHAFVASTKLD